MFISTALYTLIQAHSSLEYEILQRIVTKLYEMAHVK